MIALVCAALYLCADYVLNKLGFSAGWIILWPLNGITVALLIMIPRSDWPAVLLGVGLGTGIGEVLDGNTVASELILRLCSIFEIFLAAWLLPAFKDLDSWLRKPRIFYRFALALAAGPGISGLVAALFFYLRSHQSFFSAFDEWAFADAVGIAGFFPLALSARSTEMRALFHPRALPRTVLVLGAAFVLITMGLYSSRYPLIFIVYPTLLAVDLLLSFSGSAIAAAGLCFIAIYLTVNSHGLFGAWPADLPVTRDVALQSFLAFHLLALFPASILIRERRSLVQDLHSSNAQLLMLASLDGLTGVPNRRSFNENFDQEWKRAIRLKTPLALVMMDVDVFKQFNDRYGHHAGDECLRTVAQTLAGNLRRAQDLLARYGGEEFVLLLPHTDLNGARHIAELVRQAIYDLRIPHADSPWRSVSISVGCSSVIPTLESNPRGLLNLADTALYRAKAAGRNRTEVVASIRQPSFTIPESST